MTTNGFSILVVDQNEVFREQIAEALAASGFHAMQAKDGVEALMLIDASGTAIKVLLLDVALPRLNGRELARVISSAHRDIKIIFTCPEEIVADERLPARNIFFLQKPFRTDELLPLIEAEMNGDQP